MLPPLMLFVLCMQVHFTRDDWRKYRWYLKDGTVPSVFKGSPSEKVSGVRSLVHKNVRGKRKSPATIAANSDPPPPKMIPTNIKATFVKQPAFNVPFLKSGSTQAKRVVVFLTSTGLQCSETLKLATSGTQSTRTVLPQVKSVEDVGPFETASPPSSNSHSEKTAYPQAKSVEELFTENGLDWAETGTHFLSSLM